MFILLSSCSAEEDRSVTSALQAGFSDESLTADATELLDLELSNKLYSPTSSDISSTMKKTLKRKYNDSYLDIVFAETTDNKSQCVIWGKVLPNSSMFQAKIRRHFEGSIQNSRINQLIFSEGIKLNSGKSRNIYRIIQKLSTKRL
ncbi:hypothetical protein AVEN_107938-1 [Araneus ventricosus]|uniref:Uncharacterized protein n=1 Tax=Araneus ventricosus TaxID=182803 RepID=A0A4Y2IW78_ARAVE|nr:hypothetical protein AVEN_107938-1 [Araneus ventricosus]